MGIVKDMTGRRFGRLTVVERAPGSKNRRALWLCVCDCGEWKVTTGANLRQGGCRSCGCLQREARIRNGEANETHGMSHTSLHYKWTSMKSRCHDPNCKEYPRYGGRGITVCDEWRDDFEPFRDWALANGFSARLSIDRIDNDGPYAPWNCRWATAREQARNRRNNRLLSLGGETKTLVEWSEARGFSVRTLQRRLKMHPPEVALTVPVVKGGAPMRRVGRGKRKEGGTEGSGSGLAA